MSTGSQRAPVRPPGTIRIGAPLLYRAFIACCAVYFAAAILQDILRYGVNVPFWDEWELAGVLRRLAMGQMSWPQAMLHSIGEHRVAMQLLISLANWQAAGMNTRAAMVVNWAMAAGFCVLAAVVTRRAVAAGSHMPWTVLGSAAFFVFNPAAYQVWVWGLPLVHLIGPLLFLCGVALAQSRLPDSAKIAGMSVFALLASFTLASGLLLWLLFPAVLACRTPPGLWRRQRVALAAGAVVLLLTIAAVLPGHSAARSGGGPAVVAGFFLAYTGSMAGLIADPMPIRFAQAPGLALLVLFFAAAGLAARRCRGQPEWPALVVWGCLGFYSIGSGVLAALSRSGFGPGYALEASRYVLASCFLPMACVAIGALLARSLARELPQRVWLYSWVLSATVALVVAGCGFRVLQTGRALAIMNHYYYWETTGKVALAASNLMDLPQYRNIYPSDSPAEFKRTARYLNGIGWLRPRLWDEAFIRRLASPARAEERGAGVVESLSAGGEKIRLSGWGYLPEADQRPHGILIVAVPERAAPRLLAVAFPSGPRGGFPVTWTWSAEVAAGPPLPSGTRIRCFAYNAHTGEAHLMAGQHLLE